MTVFKSNFKSLQSQTQLGHYLAGLIEGDGHFSKSQLIISSHIKDRPVLEALRKHVGYGTIKPYSQQNKALRFVISSKAGLKHVLQLINGKLIGTAKYNQLLKHNYESRFNLDLQPPKKLSLDNAWLSGFADADGCFSIVMRQCHTSKTGLRVDLRLTIAQKDPALLTQIQDLFNASKLYTSKNPKSPHSKLTLSGYKRLPNVIDYFDAYPPLGGKLTHYRMFRRCFRLMQLKKHLTEEGLIKVKHTMQTLKNTYKA